MRGPNSLVRRERSKMLKWNETKTIDLFLLGQAERRRSISCNFIVCTLVIKVENWRVEEFSGHREATARPVLFSSSVSLRDEWMNEMNRCLLNIPPALLCSVLFCSIVYLSSEERKRKERFKTNFFPFVLLHQSRYPYTSHLSRWPQNACEGP